MEQILMLKVLEMKLMENILTLKVLEHKVNVFGRT